MKKARNNHVNNVNVVLPTKLTSGIVTLSQIRLLVYGAPKIGKTTLLIGFPNMLILATEKGYQAHKVYKNDITSWEVFKENVKLIIKGKHSY